MAIPPGVSTHPDELPVVLAKLTQTSAELLVLAERIRQLEAENNWFRERFNCTQRTIFGPSSETTPPELQLLFNEVEVQADPRVPEPALDKVARGVQKTKGKRDADYAGLPIEIQRHELPEDQRQCPQCSGAMHEMGSDLSRELKIIPAQVSVVHHLRLKYSCRRCANHDADPPVVVAAPPRAQAFPKSAASASVVAYIIAAKYEMGSPLHRLEAHFAEMGLDLSRQTMANWVIWGGKLLRPVYDALHRVLLTQDICHADETTLQVLRESDREATSKSYMWAYCTGRHDLPVVLFDYSPTRAYEHAQNFLKGFEGYLHADGYGCYDTLPGVTVVGCMAHARRKFEEARTALPKPDQKKMNAPNKGLDFCNRLFRFEREAHDMSIEERFDYRKLHSAPVLKEFHEWLVAQATGVTPKSKLGEAIGYCLNQWTKLNNFLLDGRLEISNNRCERAIKPFVLGRKNWLFANTPAGAKASAIMYSLVETAKANNLVPRDYLTHLFERLPTINANDPEAVAELLPWAPDVQARCAIGKPKPS